MAFGCTPTFAGVFVVAAPRILEDVRNTGRPTAECRGFPCRNDARSRACLPECSGGHRTRSTGARSICAVGSVSVPQPELLKKANHSQRWLVVGAEVLYQGETRIRERS